MSEPKILPPRPTRHLARLTLVAFLFTFIASRTLVILIMARKMPDLFLHMGGTHVHHLNYGIFLLSAIGAILLFVPLRETGRQWISFAYGFAMALTFDEFGMWVHLGGSYWQRASFDAVVIISAALGLIAYAPSLKRFHTQHWFWTSVLTAVVLGAIFLLGLSVTHWADRLAPWLQTIETTG